MPFNARWIETPDDWQCVSCRRLKAEITRPDKSGQPFGQLHYHHDHMADFTKDRLKELFGPDWAHHAEQAHPGADYFRTSADRLLSRFPDSLICMDCNTADGNVKAKLGLDPYFTFAPNEIRRFCRIGGGRAHALILEAAKSIYDEQVPMLDERKRLAEKLAQRIVDGRFWTAGVSFEHGFLS